MSLREKQMAERRARILSSARKLIRRTGGTDFTMSALAREAEVAPATPFNLFGSKESLLYELLLRSLSDFFARAEVSRSDDPVEQVLLAVDAAVDVFLKNPTQLRPLYRFLLGVTDPKSRPEFLRLSRTYWRNSLKGAEEEGIITEAQADVFASCLMAQILGMLDLWVHKDVSDEVFRGQLILGALMSSTALVKAKDLGAHRLRIEEAMKNLQEASKEPKAS